MCVSIVVVLLNPPFIVTTNISFTRHFVANPATTFTKKRGTLGRNPKTLQNTPVLNKPKTQHLRIQMLNCPSASTGPLIYLKNHRRSNALVERGPFLASCRTKTISVKIAYERWTMLANLSHLKSPNESDLVRILGPTSGLGSFSARVTNK